jgi:hypothetical protein
MGLKAVLFPEQVLKDRFVSFDVAAIAEDSPMQQQLTRSCQSSQLARFLGGGNLWLNLA